MNLGNNKDQKEPTQEVIKLILELKETKLQTKDRSKLFFIKIL